MVIKQTDTDDGPTIGEFGKPSIPESIQINGKLASVPTITPQAMDNMIKSDGEVSGLLRLINVPLRSANFRIHPPKKQAKRANRETNLVEETFRNPPHSGGMRTDMYTVMSTSLKMLVDGWSPHEMVWHIVKGFVRVDKIAHRPVSTINVKTDKHGNIIDYTQKPLLEGLLLDNDMADIPIAPDKVLHFVHSPEVNPVFGRSLFIQSFYHYEKKHKLYYIAHIAAQIRALKFRILQSPKDTPEPKIEKMLGLVSKLGFNSSLHLPDGWEIDFPEMGGESPDVLPLIQHHDSQMAKSVLAQVLDVGVEGQTGSFNLSDTHLDIFITNLELIAKQIATVFNNQLIPKLIDWNFGTGLYPTIEFMPFDRNDRKNLAALFSRIATAKTVNVTDGFRLQIEKRVAQDIGLDIDYEELEKRLEDNGTVFPVEEEKESSQEAAD